MNETKEPMAPRQDRNKVVGQHGELADVCHVVQYGILDYYPHLLRIQHPESDGLHRHHPNSHYAEAVMKWSCPDAQ